MPSCPGVQALHLEPTNLGQHTSKWLLHSSLPAPACNSWSGTHSAACFEAGLMRLSARHPTPTISFRPTVSSKHAPEKLVTTVI